MDIGDKSVAVAQQQMGDQDLTKLKVQMDGLRSRLGPGRNQEKQLKEACKNFEAVFINQIWQQMRKSVPKEGYLHSPMEEQYVSLFDKEFSEKMSENGGIGLSDLLYTQLKDKLKRASDKTLPSQQGPRTENGLPGLSLHQGRELPPLERIAGPAEARAGDLPELKGAKVMDQVEAIARKVEGGEAEASAAAPSAAPAAAPAANRVKTYVRKLKGLSGNGRKLAKVG